MSRTRRLPLLALPLAFCLLLFAPPPALAQETATIETGRALFQEGRFAEAQEILLSLAPATEAESIEQPFLLGLIALETGRPRAAIERFESILSRHPHLIRVRLELARAYYLIGEDDKSRRHFSQVLGAEGLPRGVENNVAGFLNRIQARRNWSADLSLALLPQSNINQGSEERIIYLGPLPLRLNEDARKQSGTGVEASGGVSWQPRLEGDWRGRLALSGRVQRFDNSEWNDTLLGSDIGLLRLFDGGSVGGGLRLQRRWRGGGGFPSGEGYSWRRGFWASHQVQFLRRNRLETSAELAHLDHDQRNHSNGWTARLAPNLVRALSASSRLRVGASWQITEAEVGYESNHLLGASATLTHAFAGGLTASADIGAHRKRYHGDHPLFAEPRKEVLYFAGLRLLHRELRWRGIAPYAEYRYERNNAAPDLFDYDNHIGTLGITRTF